MGFRVEELVYFQNQRPRGYLSRLDPDRVLQCDTMKSCADLPQARLLIFLIYAQAVTVAFRSCMYICLVTSTPAGDQELSAGERRAVHVLPISSDQPGINKTMMHTLRYILETSVEPRCIQVHPRFSHVGFVVVDVRQKKLDFVVGPNESILEHPCMVFV